MHRFHGSPFNDFIRVTLPFEVHRAWNLRDKSDTSTWHRTVKRLESKCMALPPPPSSLLTEPLLQTRLTTSMVAEFQTQSAPGLAQPLPHPRLAKLGKTFFVSWSRLALPVQQLQEGQNAVLFPETQPRNGENLLTPLQSSRIKRGWGEEEVWISFPVLERSEQVVIHKTRRFTKEHSLCLPHCTG